jgi:aerobic carbon-monoxide dehydrogenase small subunit
MKLHRVEFKVNGRSVVIDVEPRLTLADALRDRVGLTGTHLGCEHGVCGACTVIVDDEPARSCLILAVQAEGTEVTTVEGVSPVSGLSPIQEALRQHHGLQCGFCTPGMVIALHHLFSAKLNPTQEEIKEALSGQLCRCTGYQGIVAAAKAVAMHRTTTN